MISGKLTDLLDQLPDHPRIRQGIAALVDYAQGRRPEIDEIVRTRKEGEGAARWDIDGDAVYAHLQAYRPIPRERGQFEAHRRYLDIQYLCDGCEAIEVAGCEAAMQSEAYDADKDVLLRPLTDSPHTRLTLRSGDVAVFFPGELHAPCLRVDGETGGVRKIVVKVALDEENPPA